MTARQAALLGLLAAIWGASYLLIKIALRSFSPAAVVVARCGLAALILLAVVLARGPAGRAELRRQRRRPWTSIGFGLLAVGLPFLLISLGELEVDSGLTAVLIAPSPLVVALLAPWLDPSERVGPRGGAGLVVGLVGVALAVGGGTLHGPAEILGALAILAAAVSYGIANLVAKRAYAATDPVVTSLVALVVATAVALPPAVATVPSRAPSAASWAAVATLGVVGTALAFVIYYLLIHRIGAGRAALVAYLAPGIAIVYGALILSERVHAAAVIGLVLILAGVWLAGGRRRGTMGPAPAGAERRPARSRS